MRAARRHAVDLILLDGARADAAGGDESGALQYVIDQAPCRVELMGGSGAPGLPEAPTLD